MLDAFDVDFSPIVVRKDPRVIVADISIESQPKHGTLHVEGYIETVPWIDLEPCWNLEG